MIPPIQSRKLGVHGIWKVIPEEREVKIQEQAAIVQILWMEAFVGGFA